MRSGIDLVDHPQSLGVVFFLDLNLGVEMAARLQVVEQVALAFVQQIVVDGVFFVDRDFFFQHAAADVVSPGVDHHHRAGIDLKGEIHGIGFRMVGLVGDGNLRQRAVLLLESSCAAVAASRSPGRP